MTLRTSAITSGPMPSPARIRREGVLIGDPRAKMGPPRVNRPFGRVKHRAVPQAQLPASHLIAARTKIHGWLVADLRGQQLNGSAIHSDHDVCSSKARCPVMTARASTISIFGSSRRLSPTRSGNTKWNRQLCSIGPAARGVFAWRSGYPIALPAFRASFCVLKISSIPTEILPAPCTRNFSTAELANPGPLTQSGPMPNCPTARATAEIAENNIQLQSVEGHHLPPGFKQANMRQVVIAGLPPDIRPDQSVTGGASFSLAQ